MSEPLQTQADENEVVAAELAATQQGFEALNLSDGFTRRRLTPADAESYVAFDDWAFFEGNPDTPKTHEPEHFTVDDITKGMDQGDIFEGLFDDKNNLIATMWLATHPEKGELEIINLVVHPDSRDQHIGSYFLTAAEAIAHKRAIEYCVLHVDPLNSRGMYLYSKNGYRVTAYEHSNQDGLNDWLIMTKKLDGWPEEDYAEQLEVKTGDETQLAKVLADGYVGIGYKDIAGKEDPATNIVIFAKPSVPTPE